MFFLCAALLISFVHLVQGFVDPLSSLSYKLDQASLEIMQRYDTAEEARRRAVRASQQTGGRRELLFRETIPVQSLPTSNPKDILSITIETAREEKEHLLIISNHYYIQLGQASTVDVYQFDKKIFQFYKIHTFQEIDPFELEHIMITKDGKKTNLLAIAGNANVEIVTAITTRVVIYEIIFSGRNISFREFQNFRSVSVDSMKSVTRSKTTYLVFGMRLDRSITAQHSATPAQILVLVYNPTINAFKYHSTMPAYIISDIELFTVGNTLLMTVTYYQDKHGNLNLKSPVYKFNDKTLKFEYYQGIDTRGARDIEYFQISNGHYIVIANEASGKSNLKQYGVPSTLYQFKKGKYHLVQNLETYGAVRWKSTTIPNCHNSVVLFYADRTNSNDQVGFYLFSDSEKKFNKVPLTFYSSASSLFRPRPDTLVPFMVDLNLYVAIGATDTSFGHTVYRIEYSTISQSSPWQQFTQEVSSTLKMLSENLTLIEKGIEELEQSLDKIVYTDTVQNITGHKIFLSDTAVGDLTVTNLDVSNGSIYFKSDNGSLHKADPKKYEIHNISELEAKASFQEKQIENINKSLENVFLMGKENIVTDSWTFSNIRLNSTKVTAENLVGPCGRINEIDVCEFFKDIVYQNSTDVIRGKKIFYNDQEFRKNLKISGRINDVKFPEEVVSINNDQVINSDKTFKATTVFNNSINISGVVNDVDLSEEVLLLSRDEVVSGMKTFDYDTVANGVEVEGLINDVNVTHLAKDAMLVNADQNITGLKVFENEVVSLENITVSGLTNGVDLDKFAESVIRMDLDKEVVKISGDITFEDEVIIDGNLNVSGKLNCIRFPEDVVLINSSQNITGRKVFLENVTVKQDVEVEGTVGGVNVSDLVTLSGDEVITGKKTFTGNIKLLENLVVATNKLVDQVDVSELGKNVMTINGTQNVTGFTKFQDIEIKNGLDVQGKIDNVTLDFYKELFQNAVLLEGDQTIYGSKKFSKDVTVTGNLTVNGLVNGYSIPQDFLSNSDQTIYSKVNFSNVVFKGNVTVNGTVAGVDIINLRKQLITTDTDQRITGVKTFRDDVNITGNLTICCKVNNISLSDLLTKNTNQTVTAKKYFQEVHVKNLLVVMNNVSVESTVNGVDLSELSKRLLFRSGSQHIKGKLTFENVSIAGGLTTPSINNVNLSELVRDAVFLNKDQVVTSEKTFTHMKIEGDLTTNSTIDGIDVLTLDEDIVKLNESAEITGKKTFEKIHIKKDLEVQGLVQNVNLTKLADEVVLRTSNQNISGVKTIIGDMNFHKDIQVGKLNNLDIQRDVVLKSVPQNISGVKRFMEDVVVKGDVVVASGKVNGIDLVELDKNAVRKNVEQNITGKNIINNNVSSKGNITLTGKVDGVDLSELEGNIIKLNKDQEIPGNITMTGRTIFEGNIKVEGKVNGYNLTKIVEDAVTINGTQNITGAKIFKGSFTVQQDLKVNENITVTGLVNNVNITKLAEEAVDLTSDQVITGKKTFLQKVLLDNITVGTLDGLSVSDFVTTTGNHTIQGNKIFASSIKAIGDITVKGLVDGEDIKELARDTLLQRANYTQNVTGLKTFKSMLNFESPVEIKGTLDGMSMKENEFITLDTEQNITGKLVFSENLTVEGNITVGGLVSGVNITKLDKERMTLDSFQRINGDVIIENDVDVYGNVTVNGTVNGIDVSKYMSDFNKFLLHTETYNRSIGARANGMCPAIDFVRDDVLRDAPLNLDYFIDHQRFSFGINHMEQFQIGNDVYLAVATIAKQGENCSPSLIMKYIRSLKKFITYQKIGNSGGSKFKAFKANGEIYLFLGNKEDGCLLAGYSALYKWNRLTSLFYKIQNIPTNGVTDAQAMIHHNQTVILAIANANRKTYESSLTIWELVSNHTMICLTQNITASMPTAVEMFEIENQFYMAIAMSYDAVLQSTRTTSFVYKLDSLNRWELLQQIPTSCASDVAYFKGGIHHFLAISNERSKTLQTQTSQILGVEIYQFLPSNRLFALTNSILEPFTISIQPFLFKRSRYMSVAIKHLGVKVFKFKPHIGYEEVQLIRQPGVTHLSAFTVDKASYLALGSTSVHDNNGYVESSSPRIIEAQLSGIYSSNYKGCS